MFVGTCANLFDGERCIVEIFDDVSHFAREEEEYRDSVEEGTSGPIEIEDFCRIVGDKLIVKDSYECYFYPRNNGNVYVAYDPDEDIHYFFIAV